jgi:predicted ATPase
VVFVPLADAAAVPELLVPALARALDIAEVPGQPLAATLAGELADASLLLVLDNFEHVLDAAPDVSDLLSAAPGLRVLASSRERLSLSFEQVYPVPPLPLPDPRDLVPGAAGLARALAESPALALFTARARTAAYDFALTTENLRTVAELCRRLDGLPLAIELAAARADSLSPAEMLDALASRLDVAGDGPRDLPARQRTLRGAIDWSMSLLDPVDRDLFERLGAFAGGCELAAVIAAGPVDVAGGDLAKRLSGLVDKSLVRLERTDGQPARYTMLQTIHAYAAERLADSAGATGVQAAHGQYYAGLATRAERGMIGPRQARWAARVEREYQNLRAAFERSLASGGAPDVAVRVALGLWRFWRTGSHIGEGRDWLARLLGADSPERAQILHAAAVLAGAQDDHETASALAGESLTLARRAGDARTTAQACNALGIGALAAGDYPGARRYFTDSLALWRDLDAPLGLAMAHGNLTKVALRTGDIDTAASHAAQCLELDRRAGNTRGIMLGRLCLGEIMLIRQDTEQARAHLTEALAHSQSLGDVFGEAMARHHLGQAAWYDGDPVTAVRQVGAALALRHEVGDREDLAISLELLATLLATDATAAHATVAARLVGAAQTLRSRHRLPDGGEHVDTGATLDALRDTLGPAAVAAAVTAGQSAALDAVVADAMACVNGYAA